MLVKLNGGLARLQAEMLDKQSQWIRWMVRPFIWLQTSIIILWRQALFVRIL